MQRKLFTLLTLVALLLPLGAWADDFVNLTPRPKTMTVTGGSITMPTSFTISCSSLPDSCVLEVQRFATAYSAVTGANVTVVADDADAFVQVGMLASTSTLKTGGYTLSVSDAGVKIKAKEAAGFFYAFQSVKKMLPANVMAGVKDASVTTYTLPKVSITDEPRFQYRGFMLDVARHFFTVDEVKQMIDLMSFYKLNSFHWHLSDDQGWRVEIKKYPRLTSVGSIAPNSRFTDMYECTQYWINKAYGPYFYTQDEIRDVVAYAAERHITIIPEIDMPGHFCAALTAYPEFSCTPNGTHVVQTDGGIYSDILNVANPDAVQFTKDVLEELMDLFPGETLNIGGDECPTSAWQNNAECKALYTSLGLTDYRQLQSHFIGDMADFVKAKGRRLAIWNEGITASGADLDIMKATDATVYCWTSPEAAATKAKQLGLRNIYTPWGPYYINRKQGSSETDPPGAGTGSDDVKATYNQSIPSATDYGIQGTFWTEHVSDADYMQWLALPRLIAVAERAWTPEANKNFEDFRKRMSADTVLLNYGGYKYCKYYMLDAEGTASDTIFPTTSTAEAKHYYRIISGGTDATRVGRCIELLSSSSSLISTYSGKGAKANVLWTNTQAEEGADNYDYQWWMLEEDAAHPGKYALVNKAVPAGSVNPTPSAKSTSGRWSYDVATKNYNFVLGTGAYGTKNGNYYYTIASDKVSGQYLNSSMSGQGLAVNLYSNPNDGCGGQWEFVSAEGTSVPVDTFEYLVVGQNYVFSNAVEGFDSTAIVDVKTSTNLKHSTSADANNAWQVTTSTINADGSQTVSLKNAATGRFIAAVGSFESNKGCPVTVASSGTDAVTLAIDTKTQALRVKVGSKSLFALPSGLVYAGPTISGASYDAAVKQGAEWIATPVNVVTFSCVDEGGETLGTVVRSIPTSKTSIAAADCPTFHNLSVVSLEQTDANAYKVTYHRAAYAVHFSLTDEKGAMLEADDVDVPVGETYTVKFPAPKYYTLQSSSVNDGETLTLTADTTLTAVYSTDAITGVKRDGNVVTKVEAGKSYLLYDATTASGRSGYRTIMADNKKINRVLSAEGATPASIWTLEKVGTSFRVKNEYYNLYVPQLVQSTATTASTSGASFSFKLNSDGETWTIKGTNGQYWDGVENGDLVGWNAGNGHPIRITTFFAQPMYTVDITCEDEDGSTLTSSSTLLAAGTAYTLNLPTISGYSLVKTTGAETYTGTVEGFVKVTATYKKDVDAITTVTTTATPSQGIYDLQGRRLPAVNRRGIYIVNGQKVVVR